MSVQYTHQVDGIPVNNQLPVLPLVPAALGIDIAVS
jgi:hypothetical protein